MGGVGCDVTTGARVPGFGAPKPLPGVNRGRRMQRWGRFRHHTVAAARKALLKRRAGQDGAEQHQAWSSSLLGVLPSRLRPTGGGSVGP